MLIQNDGTQHSERDYNSGDRKINLYICDNRKSHMPKTEPVTIVKSSATEMV
jgi:hypothetical protein